MIKKTVWAYGHRMVWFAFARCRGCLISRRFDCLGELLSVESGKPQLSKYKGKKKKKTWLIWERNKQRPLDFMSEDSKNWG